MEEPPPITPQKGHQNLEKEVTIQPIPPIPLIPKKKKKNKKKTKTKTKSLYQTNQILKFFYPKYRLCCLTVVRDADEATVTYFDATTTFIFAKTFL